MHPHAALPRGFAKKIKGEGRTQTDTLTVSSRISPRNKNTSKSARSHPMTAARHNRLIVKGAEHVKPLRGRLGHYNGHRPRQSRHQRPPDCDEPVAAPLAAPVQRRRFLVAWSTSATGSPEPVQELAGHEP